MGFLAFRDISFKINGKPLFCNSLSLNQQVELSQPFLEGEIVNDRSISNSPRLTQLNINYFLTGRCPLKDYCFTDYKNPLTGTLNDTLDFNLGYLQSYQLSAKPNQPISISAQIIVTDGITGSLGTITPSHYPDNTAFWNYNDASFSDNSLNIVGYDWRFESQVDPIYYQKETGLSTINPDRVAIGQKEISVNITSDSQDLNLEFTGSQYNIDFTCRHPSQDITETYSCSGFINRKDFSVSDNIHQTTYSIKQSHLNEFPKIATVDTSQYPAQNYIVISSQVYPNNFSTRTNGFPIVEKVVLGDRTLKFSMSVNPLSNDVILATIPNDAINGYLTVHTTKGIVQYPTPLTLNFSGITISGFYPITGAEHGLVSITGKNFYRISDVKFGNKSCVFNVAETTGNYHRINAYVPHDTSIAQISVHSFLRNNSGFSTGNFYPTMDILSFTPTGTWSGICQISGKNFTGITNVYFNGVRSPNFTVNNNEHITARTPITGAGYAKGYVSISGVQGMDVYSKTIYQPILKITGISLISGRPDNDIKLSGIFDSGYLCFDSVSGGYKVAFGDTYSIFYRSGNINDFVLTGYVPLASFTSAAPAMVEPDGVTKYDKFTGNFIQIAKPIVNSINGMATRPTLPIYYRSDIVIQGENFNFLFGNPYVVLISGNGFTSAGVMGVTRNVVTTYSDVIASDDGTTLTVKNVRMTGRFDEIMGARVAVVNYAGTGWYSSEIIFVNDNYAQSFRSPQSAAFFDEAKLGIWNTRNATFESVIDFPITIALGQPSITDAGKTISVSRRFGTLDTPTGPYGVNSTSGWMDFIFEKPVDFGGVIVYQSPTIASTDDAHIAIIGTWPYQFYPLATQYLLANTGILECYTGELTSLGRTFFTGITFSSSQNEITKVLPNLKYPITRLGKVCHRHRGG